MTRRSPNRSVNQPSQPSSAGAFAAAITATADGAVLSVAVVPRAGVSAVDGPIDGVVRVRVAAPPVDGAANAALARFLAARVGLPRGRVRILVGDTSRRKRILFVGLAPEELAERLHRPR